MAQYLQSWEHNWKQIGSGKSPCSPNNPYDGKRSPNDDILYQGCSSSSGASSKDRGSCQGGSRPYSEGGLHVGGSPLTASVARSGYNSRDGSGYDVDTSICGDSSYGGGSSCRGGNSSSGIRSQFLGRR